MSLPFKTSLLVALLALSACATEIPWDDGATSSLRVGMTRDEVEAAFGRPTYQSTESDGSTIWRYLRSNESTASASSSQELTVTFAGDRVVAHTHSASSTTTTTTTTP